MDNYSQGNGERVLSCLTTVTWAINDRAAPVPAWARRYSLILTIYMSCFVVQNWMWSIICGLGVVGLQKTQRERCRLLELMSILRILLFQTESAVLLCNCPFQPFLALSSWSSLMAHFLSFVFMPAAVCKLPVNSKALSTCSRMIITEWQTANRVCTSWAAHLPLIGAINHYWMGFGGCFWYKILKVTSFVCSASQSPPVFSA